MTMTHQEHCEKLTRDFDPEAVRSDLGSELEADAEIAGALDLFCRIRDSYEDGDDSWVSDFRCQRLVGVLTDWAFQKRREKARQ
jgi:hypothetical protein